MPQPARETRYTAATSMTWLLLAYLRDAGVDVPGFVHRLGLRMRDLTAEDTRLPLSELHALWQGAVELTGDEALGVRVAALFDPHSNFSLPAPFSLYEHLGRTSATLREAFVNQAGFLRLLRDGTQIVLEGPAERPITHWVFSVPGEPRASIEFQMAAALLLTRRIAGEREIVPVEVWLARPPPADPAPYLQLFRAPLRFDAEYDATVSYGEELDRPLATANTAVLEIHRRRAHKLIDALPAIDDFAQLVRERIEGELPFGNTNASAVAEKLGISPRTLHRRLQAEAISYQDLLDSVRCRLATRHLVSRRHTINEVATLVGFAQPSAFHRAFKAWTGETPADYQARLGSGVRAFEPANAAEAARRHTPESER